MEQQSKGIEIRFSDLWTILKRCWWLMLAVMLVVFTGSYVFAKKTYTPEYTATAIVWALGNNANTSTTGGATSTADVNIATALINDYKVLLTTDDLLQDVIKNEGLQIKPSQLRGMIKVSHETSTRVMEISVTSRRPEGAMNTVNELVTVFCDRINSKNASGEVDDDSTATDKGEVNKDLVRVWSYATLPESPSNSVSVLKLGLIALVCAVAVYAVYFVLYLMDDKISTADDVERYLGVSMLGVVPNRQDVMRRRRTKGGYYGFENGTGGGGTQSSNRGGNQ